MAQIITIGKRRWLAGMHWTSYEAVPDKMELQVDAQRLAQADEGVIPTWIALRTGEAAIQAGFSDTVIGVKHPKNIASLAAMLADSEKQPWQGTFQLAEDLWWYIAVRDDHAILPDGDVVGSKADIDAAKLRHAHFIDWHVVEGDLAALTVLLQSVKHKPTAVRSTYDSHRPVVGILVAGAVLLGLALAAWQWQEHQAETERLRIQLLQKLHLQQQQAAPQAPTVEQLLAAVPTPSHWLAACRDAVYPLPLSKAGWQLDNVSCNGTSAIVHWRRSDGATVAARPEGTLLPDDNAVDQSTPLEFSGDIGRDQVGALPAARQALKAWAQARGLSLRLEQPAPPAAMPGSNQNPVPVVVPNHLAFGMDMASPFAFGDEFDALPGLRLTSIKSLPGGRWNVKGVIYGRT